MFLFDYVIDYVIISFFILPLLNKKMDQGQTTTTVTLAEKVSKVLKERLEEHSSSKKSVQDELNAAFAGIRKMVDDFEKKINADLQESFVAEDNRLQKVLDEIQALTSENKCGEELEAAVQKASAELAVRQKYNLEKIERVVSYIESCFELGIKKELVKEWLTVNKVNNLRATVISAGRVFIDFDIIPNKILSDNGIEDTTVYQAVVCKEGTAESEAQTYYIKTVEVSNKKYYSFLPDSMEPETTYNVKVKGTLAGKESELSDMTLFSTLDFPNYCEWKECPEYVSDRYMYAVKRSNRRIANKINATDFCTITGTTSFPPGRATTWGVRMVNLRDSQRANVNVGVAPYDINQNRREVYSKYGWYFCCYYSTLTSGPPHNYNFRDKEYGPRKKNKEYVHIGDTVSVVVDTTTGTLSFAINGTNFGVAYKEIPLDKPLVPCVHLRNEYDSVELIVQSAPTIQTVQPSQPTDETKKNV